MKNSLALALLCCAASLPPLPPGATKLYSPKDAEFRRSLARSITPPLHHSIAPVPHARTLPRFNALTAPFAITNLTVTADSATLSWQNALPPAWVLKSTDLVTWQPDGDPTLRTSHTIATTNAQMFFRVRQAVPLLLTQTNAPRLIWRIPELMPADTFSIFKIERSDSGVAGDETTNGTLGGSPVTLATLTNKTTVGGAGFRIPVPGANVIKDATGAALPTMLVNGSQQPVVTVGDSSWMTDPLGDVYLNVPGKGLFKVISRPDATHVVLQYDISNGQVSGSIPPSVDHQGENVLAGSQIVPGSFNDPTQPNPSLFYRVTGTTANGVVVPYNVVSASNATPGSAAWAKRFGGTNTDIGGAVTTDPSGNIVAVGTFQASVNLGGDDLTSPSGWSTVFIAKFLPSGAHVWSKAFGGNNITVPNCVALDASGNIFVGGYFAGTANFGGANITSKGGNDCFLAKYDAQGNHQWSIGFGMGSWDQVSSLAVDSQGNVILTGYYGGATGSMQVRGTDGAGIDLYGTSWAAFLAKFSSSGAYVFAKDLSSFGSDKGVAVAVDKRPNPANNLPYDNILVAGNATYQINFGGGTLGQGGWLAKFDPSGNYLNQRQVGGGATVFGMTPDSNGGILISGNFGGSTDLGGGSVTGAAGAVNGFVVRYSMDDLSWKSQALMLTTANSAIAPGPMAVDSQNNIFITGYFVGTCNAGTKSMSSLYNEAFLLKYATSGTTIAATPTWSDVFVMASDLNHLYYSYGNGVAVNNGTPVLIGYFNGTGVLGSASLTSVGGYDIFIASINP